MNQLPGLKPWVSGMRRNSLRFAPGSHSSPGLKAWSFLADFINSLRTEMKTSSKIQSIARALTIIDTLAEARGELALNEIARRLGLAKSTTYGLISTLKDFGYVEQSAFNCKYKLGLRLFEVGSVVAESWEIRSVASPFIQRLLEEVGETVHLGILDKYEVLYIDKRETTGALRIVSQVGMRLPAHCTGIGKVLLAYLSPEARLEVIRVKGLPRYTRNTLTDPKVVEAELAKVRQQGYAIDNEEIMDSLRCIAAPIRNQVGQVVSAISIAGPVSRLRNEQFKKAIRRVIQTAAVISANLGYRPKNQPENHAAGYLVGGVVRK
jgi:DNA-binding IclR family transcriptional regulator